MAAKRKTTTRTRKASPPTFRERAVQFAKDSQVLIGFLLLLIGTTSGYLYRHFTATERIPEIEQTVSRLAEIEADRQDEKNRQVEERQKLKEACAMDVLTLRECSRKGLGPMHPAWRAKVEAAKKGE